jgi:aminoglycoside phosphotransferase (APT) family kinase protein
VPPQQTHHLTFKDDTVAKRYVAWQRDEPGREWAGLTLLAKQAPGLAPIPLRREEYDGEPTVVMSRLPGVPLGERPLPPAQVTALGDALRRLFAIPVEVVREAGLGERNNGPAPFSASVRELAAQEYALEGCRDPGLVAEARSAARSWLEEFHAWPEAAENSVLGMADGNLANFLWDGEQCRLVDFEDCGVSDPAYELADLVEHASLRLPRLAEAEALVAAVGLTAEQRLRWAGYRPLFAAFWLLMLLPGNPAFARNPPGSTEDQAHHLLHLLAPLPDLP